MGQTVKSLREARGWSKEAAAQRMRQVGLAWESYQLADLENGRRHDVNLGELLLLAETFGVTVPELVRGSGAAQLGAMKRPTERPLRLLRSLLAGGPPPNRDLLGPRPIPGHDPERWGDPPYWERLGGRVGYNYSSTTVDVARRLGEDVDTVSEAARELWDTPILDVARNRLVTEQGRGQDDVMHDLVEQLRTHLAEKRQETE